MSVFSRFLFFGLLFPFSVIAQTYPKDDVSQFIVQAEKHFEAISKGMIGYGFDNCQLPGALTDFTPNYAFTPPQSQQGQWSIGHVSEGGLQQGFICLTGSVSGDFPLFSQGLVNRHPGLVSSNTCPAIESQFSETPYLTWWLPVKSYPADCHLGVTPE